MEKSQHGLNNWNYIKHAFKLSFFSITELYLDISILKASRLAVRKMLSLHLCCRRHKRGYLSMTSCNVPLIYNNRINFFQAYIWKSLWIQQLFFFSTLCILIWRCFKKRKTALSSFLHIENIALLSSYLFGLVCVLVL